MRLLFKQRMFSWFDSYDIYDEQGLTVFTVRGKLAWGHMLEIYDANNHHVGTLKERVITLLPKFEIYLGDQFAGEIVKEFTFFKPSFSVRCNGWQVEGDFFEWDYQIRNGAEVVATIQKQLLNWTDTYIIDINNPDNQLLALMVVLAIDAVKCSQRN